MAIFTIDIGGTKCAVGVGDAGSITDLVSWPTEIGGPQHTLDKVTQQFNAFINNGHTFQAVGVCFGGPVNYATNTVYTSVHKAGWDEFNFGTWSNTQLGLPIAIDNDANIGALAEYHFGGYENPESLLYVTISTGIGAGLVINGSLLHGFRNSAGELGHIRITDEPLECQCGRLGCFERVCSGAWLERTHGRPAEVLLAEDAFLSTYAENLARGFADAVLLYNPEVLVIGGGISNAGPRLLERVRITLKKELGSWAHLMPRIEISTLGPSGVHLGAMELARGLL